VSEQHTTGGDVLSAHHVLEYPYTRSVGPVVGRFLGALRDCRIEGVRTKAGKVLVPPIEYDPATAEAVTEDYVDVGPGGTVTTWCWVAQPRTKQPLERPFAWALIRLDGADTALLHAVDAGSAAAMSTGMRVRPRWRAQRIGMITDIECFEPEPK
jgi:uncharacterized OB-fold protein